MNKKIPSVNWKLLATDLGQELAHASTANEIGRMGQAHLSVPKTEHPNAAITSVRSQAGYDWVMSMADSSLEEGRKREEVAKFAEALLPPDSDALQSIFARLRVQSPRRTTSAFWAMLHPVLVSLVRRRFEDGHRADAVEAAFKEINTRVKRAVQEASGRELDGADLMRQAFSDKNPVLLLADLTTESGRNIQVGYMQIFAGAMQGIRNPAAHGNIDVPRDEAIHLFFLASLLMRRLDAAQVARRKTPPGSDAARRTNEP